MPKHFDASRGARIRRVAFNSGAALFAKAASILVTLLLFPMLIGYLGKSDFAIWVAVVSVVQVLSWADLGIGNSTVTLIARQAGASDSLAEVRATISSAYASMLSSVGLIAMLLAGLWTAGATAWLGAGDGHALFLIGLVAFLLYMPSSMAGGIQMGLGLAGNNYVYQAGSTVTMGLLSFLAVKAGLGLGILIAIACFTPVSFNIVNTIAFFAKRPLLRPALRFATKARAVSLLRLGGLFMVLQLGVVALNSADSIIVLNRAGPSDVVDYSAVSRIFGAFSGLASMLFAQLWPEYGAAHVRGDYRWMRQTFVRSVAIALLFGLGGGACMVAFHELVFRLWLGSAVQPPHQLIVVAAACFVIDLVGQCIAMLLNGMALVFPQIVLTLCFVVLCVPLKWHLAATNGAVGVYEASIAAYLVAILLPYAVLLPRLLRPQA